MSEEKLESKPRQRVTLAVRLRMRLRGWKRRSRAGSSSRAVPRFSRHHLPADDDKQMSRVEFPAAFYLLMEQNQTQQLIDFNLEPSVTKLVRVRMSSKECPPLF